MSLLHIYFDRLSRRYLETPSENIFVAALKLSVRLLLFGLALLIAYMKLST